MLRFKPSTRSTPSTHLMACSQILTSLGPVEETQEGNDGCSGHNGHNGHGEPQDMGAMGGKEEMAADKFLAGAVEINPDELSCGRMVLAAARTFASHKIQALVSDVHTIARQLRRVLIWQLLIH